MVTRIDRVAGTLPAGLAALGAEARAEGYSHLERLAADWETGATRFNRLGEALLAAWVDERLAGIGGLTLDPVEPNALRLRRFYVSAAYRRLGLGRALAQMLLAQADAMNRAILVNAAPGSVAFWERLGFAPEPRNGHTHRLAVTSAGGAH